MIAIDVNFSWYSVLSKVISYLSED